MTEQVREPETAPKVTVYITNHNYGHYISQAIDSVLQQSMQNFELIIIDDGSTDGSHAEIHKYQNEPRIQTVFQHQKGLNVTNNIALRLSRGQYVVRLDADDILHPDALKVLSGFLDTNEHVGLVFPDYYHIDATGTTLEVVQRHDFNQVTLLDQPAHGACTMIRRKCLEDLGGYDESYFCQDGFELWMRFIEHYRVANVNQPLFYYRQHSSNLTRDEGRLLSTRAMILARQAAVRGAKERCTAVIPIRGHRFDPRSEGLRILGSKPLVDWSLDAALDSERLDQVIVTSPDPEILDHVRSRYGNRIDVVRRDAAFASLNSNVGETVLNAVDIASGQQAEDSIIVMLLIESPFRAGQLIDTALDVMQVFTVDSAIGVRPELDNFYQHHGDGLVPLRGNPTLRLEREQLYREAGQIFAARQKFLRENGAMAGGRMSHFVVDEMAAHRLTSRHTWDLAEMIAAGNPVTYRKRGTTANAS